MRKPRLSALHAVLVAGLLAGTAFAAQARGHWSVDLSLGFPIGPVYGGGYYGSGYYGNGYYGGPVYAAPGYGSYVSALPAGAVSVTVGGGRYWRYGGALYRPYGPRWVVVAPPIVVAGAPQVVEVAAAPPPLPVAPSRPDPIIYPRQGQDARQMEADRQECNRWATTQPAAMAEASVFQRAVEACMDGRGYTMR